MGPGQVSMFCTEGCTSIPGPEVKPKRPRNECGLGECPIVNDSSQNRENSDDGARAKGIPGRLHSHCTYQNPVGLVAGSKFHGILWTLWTLFPNTAAEVETSCRS